MGNNRLFMPTKVLFGENVVANNQQELQVYGKKAMIVTGKHSSRANGSLQDVIDALQANGQEYVIFDDIEENPSVETTAKAAQIAVNEKVDFFVAIGGGSPMDASKAISVITKNPEFLEAPEAKLYTAVDVDSYPIIAIPTTCGTGSEVTPYAVLTLHSKKTKKSMAYKIFPELALVDYHYLKTSTRDVYINTCIDALAHLLESYLNTNANKYNRIYSAEGLRIWGGIKQAIAGTKETYTDEQYETSMHASVLAGMAITHTSTSLPHGLSYALTYELGIPHGRAVGYFLPGYLREYEDQTKVKEVLDLLGFENVEEFSAYIESLIGKRDIPEELWEKNKAIMLSNPDKLKSYPYTMTKEILNRY